MEGNCRMLWVLELPFPSLSFLSFRLFSFPVLLVLSGQGGNDGDKKKKSVVMERPGDYSSGEDKSTPVLSHLAVLNTNTIR